MFHQFLAYRERRNPDGTSGSAAVEFAMVLPVVMALIVGAINYGLMGLQMSTLISAARGGAEYAKSNPTDSSLSSHAASVSSVTATTATLVCRCHFDNSIQASCPTPGTGGANPCVSHSTDPRVIYSVQVGTTQNTLFSLGAFSFSSLSATANIRFD